MKFDPTKLIRLARPRFYADQVITVQDLSAEQQYQREKQWLHNRLLHGYGVVSGLEVIVQDDEKGGAKVVVAPGYALDGWGRELIVTAQLDYHLPHEKRDLIIYLKYVDDDSIDEFAKPPVLIGVSPTITESVKLFGEPPPADRALAPTHRPDFAIPLTRVQRAHLKWQRDPNFRPSRTHS